MLSGPVKQPAAINVAGIAAKDVAKKRGAIAFLRRHPVLLLVALMFFAISVLVLIAFYISPPAQTVRTIPRRVREEEPVPVGPAVIQTADGTRSRFHNIMVNAALIVAGALLTVMLVQGVALLKSL